MIEEILFAIKLDIYLGTTDGNIYGHSDSFNLFLPSSLFSL